MVLRAAERVGNGLEDAVAVLIATAVGDEEHDVEIKHVDCDLLQDVHHLHLLESE